MLTCYRHGEAPTRPGPPECCSHSQPIAAAIADSALNCFPECRSPHTESRVAAPSLPSAAARTLRAEGGIDENRSRRPPPSDPLLTSNDVAYLREPSATTNLSFISRLCRAAGAAILSAAELRPEDAARITSQPSQPTRIHLSLGCLWLCCSQRGLLQSLPSLAAGGYENARQ